MTNQLFAIVTLCSVSQDFILWIKNKAKLFSGRINADFVTQLNWHKLPHSNMLYLTAIFNIHIVWYSRYLGVFLTLAYSDYEEFFILLSTHKL